MIFTEPLDINTVWPFNFAAPPFRTEYFQTASDYEITDGVTSIVGSFQMNVTRFGNYVSLSLVAVIEIGSAQVFSGAPQKVLDCPTWAEPVFFLDNMLRPLRSEFTAPQASLFMEVETQFAGGSGWTFNLLKDTNITQQRGYTYTTTYYTESPF